MRREPGPVNAQQGSSNAAQLQLDSIISATARNASPPPSAPLSKAKQEHEKRMGRGGERIGREGFSIRESKAILSMRKM